MLKTDNVPRSNLESWPVAGRSRPGPPGACRYGRLIVVQLQNAIWDSQGGEKSEFNELEVLNVSRCFSFGGGRTLKHAYASGKPGGPQMLISPPGILGRGHVAILSNQRLVAPFDVVVGPYETIDPRY